MRDTIDMAFEAKLICAVDDPTAFWPESHDMTDELKAFEALVRADEREIEREACAKVCDEYAKNSSNPMNFADNCAAAIRARGNT